MTNGTWYRDLYVNDKHAFTTTLKEYQRSWGKGDLETDGQLPPLLANLNAAGVADSVAVTVGSRIPRGITYQVIWSDATHNPEEVDQQVPLLLNTARMSYCSTLAFHDLNPLVAFTKSEEVQPMPPPENDEMVDKKCDIGSPLAARCPYKRAKLVKRVEELIRLHGCVPIERAAAGLIYSVTVRCGSETEIRSAKASAA